MNKKRSFWKYESFLNKGTAAVWKRICGCYVGRPTKKKKTEK